MPGFVRVAWRVSDAKQRACSVSFVHVGRQISGAATAVTGGNNCLMTAPELKTVRVVLQ